MTIFFLCCEKFSRYTRLGQFFVPPPPAQNEKKKKEYGYSMCKNENIGVEGKERE